MSLSNTAQPEPLVSFREVSFAINDGSPIIDRLSREITHGEILVLLGESGCGKTTMLRVFFSR